MKWEEEINFNCLSLAILHLIKDDPKDEEEIYTNSFCRK